MCIKTALYSHGALYCTTTLNFVHSVIILCSGNENVGFAVLTSWLQCWCQPCLCDIFGAANTVSSLFHSSVKMYTFMQPAFWLQLLVNRLSCSKPLVHAEPVISPLLFGWHVPVLSAGLYCTVVMYNFHTLSACNFEVIPYVYMLTIGSFISRDEITHGGSSVLTNYCGCMCLPELFVYCDISEHHNVCNSFIFRRFFTCTTTVTFLFALFCIVRLL